MNDKPAASGESPPSVAAEDLREPFGVLMGATDPPHLR
jgi:hypothetical protein